MQSRFEKYIRLLNDHAAESEIYQALGELHRTFATLPQEEQKFANQILTDIQSGALILEPGRNLRDYLNQYIENNRNDRIHRVATVLGADEGKLRALVEAHPTSANLNEFGRFDSLVSTVDKEKAREVIEQLLGESIPHRSLNQRIYELLRKFIIGDAEELFTTSAFMTTGMHYGETISIGTNIEHADTVNIIKGGNE